MKTKLLFIIVILTILTFMVISIVFIQLNHIKQNDNKILSNTKDSNPLSLSTSLTSSESSLFKGKYLTANVKPKWSIKEYYNGDDMSVKTNGVIYKGLTGFEIFKNDTSIFNFQGINGVGGNGLCSSIAKFKDTSKEYIKKYSDGYKEIMAQSGEFNSQIIVVDLSNSDFKDITLFNLEGRRVLDKIYWKSNNDSNYFNPLCGLSESQLNFKYVFYAVNDQQSSYYEVKISNNNSEEDLEELDLILNSLKFKTNDN